MKDEFLNLAVNRGRFWGVFLDLDFRHFRILLDLLNFQLTIQKILKFQ